MTLCGCFITRAFRTQLQCCLAENRELHTRESVNQQPEPKKPFVLPEANQTMHRAFAYLIKTRCVDPKVVSVFAGKHMIYEDVKYHNVVGLWVLIQMEFHAMHIKRGTCQKGQPFKGKCRRMRSKVQFSLGWERAIPCMYLRHRLICCLLFPCIKGSGWIIVMWHSVGWQNMR